MYCAVSKHRSIQATDNRHGKKQKLQMRTKFKFKAWKQGALSLQDSPQKPEVQQLRILAPDGQSNFPCRKPLRAISHKTLSPMVFRQTITVINSFDSVSH